MAEKLNGKALGYSLAIIGALGMLLTGIAGKFGWYQGWVDAMIEMHQFFSLSVLGIITGMIEAAFWSFTAGWLVAWGYNKFN
jgi:uncharacterized membrane protein